ncbi:hypothetical protein FD755_004762, partial [Muntiacus reevesi]
AWISDIRAGTAPSCGNHIKASCSLIAFNSDRPGVLGIVPLESQGEDKRQVTHLGCHSDLVTDLDFSPFDDFLLATASADRTVKLWRLPASGQALPSGPGLLLGPEDAQVEVLQFHPTADGVLLSAAGRCAPGAVETSPTLQWWRLLPQGTVPEKQRGGGHGPPATASLRPSLPGMGWGDPGPLLTLAASLQSWRPTGTWC